jgi:hypothetical protein
LGFTGFPALYDDHERKVVAKGSDKNDKLQKVLNDFGVAQKLLLLLQKREFLNANLI